MGNQAIHVRMYKGLLGDCFLIRCEDGKRKTHILIDCGILQRSPDEAGRMRRVAEDIRKTTGGVIDLLVVTHEHWDHICGFSHARDIFLDPAKMKIRSLWFAWTEDRGDAQATALRARFAKRNKAMALIANAVDGAPATDNPFAAAPRRALQNLQQFIGAENGELLGVSKNPHMNGETILAELAKVAEKVEYLEPGDVRSTWSTDGLKTYVLGPPRDEALLFKDLERPDHGARQHALAFNEELVLGLAGQSDCAVFDPAGESPFAKPYRGLSGKQLRKLIEAPEEVREQEAKAALASAQWFEHHYLKRAEVRRIDGDWVAAAGALALKLDSDTNNTSLVLAFELADGSLMLFAADAQVGNWESWASQLYDGQSIDELLARVAFYKVGHHGSHNATKIDDGVRKMGAEAGDLVAMIPTDEAFALVQGRKGWRMPDENVRAALIERTGGKLIYGDRRWGKLPDGETFDRGLRCALRDADFQRRLVEPDDDLFVEYCVQPAS